MQMLKENAYLSKLGERVNAKHKTDKQMEIFICRVLSRNNCVNFPALLST